MNYKWITNSNWLIPYHHHNYIYKVLFLSDYVVTIFLHRNQTSAQVTKATNSPRAEITFPSVTKDRLMFPPSLSRSPVAPVAAARSLHSHSDITSWHTSRIHSICIEWVHVTLFVCTPGSQNYGLLVWQW